MDAPHPTIDVYEARDALQRGDALLVCAYESRSSFEDAQVEGAIFYPELPHHLTASGSSPQGPIAPRLGGKPPLIVYCA